MILNTNSFDGGVSMPPSRIIHLKELLIINVKTFFQQLERNLTGTRKGRRNQLPKLTDKRSMTVVSGITRTSFL